MPSAECALRAKTLKIAPERPMERRHHDPLGDLIRAGLEIERANLVAISKLSTEIIRLTRELGAPHDEIPLSVRAHMRVPAVVECTCCKDCIGRRPCLESISGASCADRCVCLAPAD